MGILITQQAAAHRPRDSSATAGGKIMKRTPAHLETQPQNVSPPVPLPSPLSSLSWKTARVFETVQQLQLFDETSLSFLPHTDEIVEGAQRHLGRLYRHSSNGSCVKANSRPESVANVADTEQKTLDSACHPHVASS